MSAVTREPFASPSSHATNSRNTLRLLTLFAVMLVVLFKHPGVENKPKTTVLAKAEQVTEQQASR
ncbi:MAG: hypothetical protein ACRBC3_11945 [Burkholderiaceae bacterium]